MPRPARVRCIYRPLTLPVDGSPLPPPSLDDPNAQLETVWVEVDLGPTWIAAYRLGVHDGAPVIAELRVFPREADDVPRRPGEWSAAMFGMRAPVPRGGLTAQLVRQLRPADSAQEGIATWSRQLGVMGPIHLRVKLGLRTLKHALRRGRRGWTDETLALAAQFYVEIAGAHPVKDLAKAWRLKSPAQARDLLQAAREKGFLSPGRHGVKSRTLTDKARERLAAVAQEQRPS